jgi:Zn finger protein HypA/HybF involved in hydrogenase expression
VYIDLIEDNIKESIEQIVLQIGNLSDASAKRSVLEFTLFIIDNDTLVLSIADLANEKSISIYPNPFGSVLSISSEASY